MKEAISPVRAVFPIAFDKRALDEDFGTEKIKMKTGRGRRGVTCTAAATHETWQDISRAQPALHLDQFICLKTIEHTLFPVAAKSSTSAWVICSC